MDFFTLRNAVILALAQVGVVVAGVLAAGAACKWRTELNFVGWQWRTEFAAEWGFAFLALPLLWIAVAVRTLWRDRETGRTVVALTGAALLAVLIALAWTAGFGPLSRMLVGGCSFGSW